MTGYIYLAIAITAEVIATTSMKALDGLSSALSGVPGKSSLERAMRAIRGRGPLLRGVAPCGLNG